MRSKYNMNIYMTLWQTMQILSDGSRSLCSASAPLAEGP